LNVPQRPEEQQSVQDETLTEPTENKRAAPKPAADLEKQLGQLAPGSRPQPAKNEKGQLGAPDFSKSTPFQTAPAPAPALGPNEPEPARKEAAKKEPARPHSPGTLSLVFEIPQEGQKLVFTKAGGDPKLTVELRPRKSLEVLFGTLWMLPWIFLLLLTIRLFGNSRHAESAWRQLAFGLIAVGLLLFVVLPAPACFVGLALVAAGTIHATVIRHRQVAGR
jgi:hypothetical protein